MSHEKKLRSILDRVAAGTLSRRDALRKLTLLGAGAAAGMGARVGAQDASPAAGGATATQYEPQGPQVENLVFWTRSSPDSSVNEWNALIAATERYTEYTGSPVQLVTVPDADFRTRLSLAAPEGDGPDVFGPIAHDWIGEFALQGISTPLQPDEYVGFEDIAQPSIDAATFDEAVHGYPLFGESLAFFYNMDIVPEPPATWDELVSMATELTEGDQWGFAFQLMEPYYQGAFFHAFGGYVFGGEDGSLDMNDVGLNNEGSVEAAKFLRDMFNQQQPPLPEDVLDITNASGFLDGLEEAGLLAMRINGPWREPALRDAGINFGVAKLPTLPNGEPLKPFSGVQVMAMNAFGNQQDAARDLMMFLGSPEGVSLMIEGFNKAPVHASLTEDAVSFNPNLQIYMEQIEVAVPMPNIPQMSGVWDPWTDATTGIIQGDLPDEDVQALLDAAVDQIRANIEQNQ